MKGYKHLTIFERETLGQLVVGGSLANIAKAMGRDKSTLSREISRGKLGRDGYRALTTYGLLELRKHITKRPKKVLNWQTPFEVFEGLLH